MIVYRLRIRAGPRSREIRLDDRKICQDHWITVGLTKYYNIVAYRVGIRIVKFAYLGRSLVENYDSKYLSYSSYLVIFLGLLASSFYYSNLFLTLLSLSPSKNRLDGSESSFIPASMVSYS
jgi:hypothetical protein